MSGLRERSKQRRRESVMTTAEQLFRTKGYDATAIEEIAARAEVSIGTLYTYFGSKGGILHELMNPVIEDMKQKGQLVIDDPPDDAADAFAALFRAYRFSDDWKSLNLLGAFDPRNPQKDSHVQALVDEFETFIRAQLASLARKLVRLGRMNRKLKPNDVSYILTVLLFAHFEEYVTADGHMSYEDDLVHLNRRLRALFEPWTAT
jgi:AcrR family transcriptional regulator